MGVYRALPRELNHTFCAGLDPSGEGGDLLQLGVYRALPRESNHTFCAGFNPSGDVNMI